MHQRVMSFLVLGLAFGAGCVPSASNSPSGGSGGNGSSNNGSGGNGSSNNGSGGKNSSGSSSGGNGSSSNGSGGNGSSGSGSGGMSGGGSACVPNVSNLVNATGLVCALDTPAMMQGSFYAYGDGTSCTIPSGPYNPCTADKGCCISGTTTVSDDTTMYKNWGCGLGMSLNTPPGTNPTKAAYAGPVKCFNIEIAGSSGGNSVRIGFKQGSNDADVAPYVDIAAFTNGYSNKICFADAMCPDWAAMQGCTKATGDVGTPFDLQVQVSAGASATAVGKYDLCLTKVEPIVDAGATGTGGSGGGSATCKNPAGQGTITDPFGVGMISCDKKQYVVQNNDWGAKMGQTITYGTGTKMKVTQQTGTGKNNDPASFPSIFIGQNSNHSSGDAPKAVKDIAAGGLPTSWTWAKNGATGSYNAAYDVWFSTGSGGEPAASSPSGGFLMVWLHKPDDNQPIGTMMKSVKIAGVNWNVWEGNNSGNGKPCITYQSPTDVSSLSFNLGDFIRDAVDNQKYLQNSWYLTNVFAGFEIWTGGQGLETVDFTATMQ